MPPSPANPTRFRSESDCTFNLRRSKVKLFKPKREKKVYPKSSVDYWLPEYEDDDEDSPNLLVLSEEMSIREIPTIKLDDGMKQPNIV